MKYKRDEIVNCFGKLYKIIRCNKHGFTGNEYDIEAVQPDKNGTFDSHIGISEGFITKYRDNYIYKNNMLL